MRSSAEVKKELVAVRDLSEPALQDAVDIALRNAGEPDRIEEENKPLPGMVDVRERFHIKKGAQHKPNEKALYRVYNMDQTAKSDVLIRFCAT